MRILSFWGESNPCAQALQITGAHEKFHIVYSLFMYADDTSLSFASNNIDDLNRFMNEDLNCLKDWLQGNKLSLNVLKTHAMVVGSRPKLKRIADEVSGQPSFFINGTQIETVERTKYLGVQLDCHLVWDEHVKCMRTKVSSLRLSEICKEISPTGHAQ